MIYCFLSKKTKAIEIKRDCKMKETLAHVKKNILGAVFVILA